MLPTERHSAWPERYCPRLEYKHFFLTSLLQLRFSPPPPLLPPSGKDLLSYLLSLFFSSPAASCFSFCLPSFLVFAFHLLLSPSSLPFLQASVVPDFFQSSSDARICRGQGGSQVEKLTTNSNTHSLFWCRLEWLTGVKWNMRHNCVKALFLF